MQEPLGKSESSLGLFGFQQIPPCALVGGHPAGKMAAFRSDSELSCFSVSPHQPAGPSLQNAWP